MNREVRSFFDSLSRRISFLSDGLDAVQSALAFLLVFRLGRAAVRYWEARQKAGAMIELCRTLCSDALAHCAGSRRHMEDLCRWSAAFPVATKNYLRSEKGNAEELAGILSKAECDELFRAPVQPIFCLDILRCISMDWARLATTENRRRATATPDISPEHCDRWLGSSSWGSRGHDEPELVAQGLAAISRTLDGLCGTFGGMERINNTPLPFVYVSHLRTFLVLYLVSIPLVFAEVWGWATVIVTPLIAFALIGIEVAAVECERPMAHRANHMPMERFCAVVADNVLQTLQTSRSPLLASRYCGTPGGEREAEVVA